MLEIDDLVFIFMLNQTSTVLTHPVMTKKNKNFGMIKGVVQKLHPFENMKYAFPETGIFV